MTRCSRFVLALCLAGTGILAAQGRHRGAADELLERLVGRWRMTGTVHGRPVTYALTARRVLQGRFVELHWEDTHTPPTYEALVFIGVDSAGTQVIAHWLDNFGAEYSIPHATGAVRGDTLLVTFPYPTGAFFDTFTYDRRSDTWHVRLEVADAATGRRLFGEWQVQRD